MIARRSVVAALAAVPLAACGRGPNPDALRLWAMSYEGDYSPLLMPAFTARTGIPVEVQSLPWTAAHEKLLTAFAGASLPDVMMLPNGWVGEFAMIGAIAPVEPALITNLVPGARETVLHGGRAFAVPWSVAPQVQFYRRDLLAAADIETPPTNWDAWRAMGLKLKRRRPDRYAFLILLNWWDTLFTFAGQVGAGLLRDRNTRGNFQTPEFAAALDFYASLFADKLAPAVLSTEVQDPVAAFAQGWFAVYPSGPALLLDFHRRAAELPRDRWSTARMPGPDGPGRVSGVSGALAVSRQTRRPAAANALLRHLTSNESELRFQRLIGNLPRARQCLGRPAAGATRPPALCRAAAVAIAGPRHRGVGAHPYRGAAGRRARGAWRRGDPPGAGRHGPPGRPDPGQAPVAGRGGADGVSRQERTAWAFTAPVLAIILLVLVAPTLIALALSVTDYDIYALADPTNLRFVGLGNFADLFGNALFWRTLGNTALFAGLGVPLAIGASLGAALLVQDVTVRWKPMWRVLLFAPYVTSVVATAVVWRFVLNTRFGLLNYLLAQFGLAPVAWLENPHSSIPAILLFVTWKVFGYNMIVFTAALAAVPQDLMEAARLDGAGRWTRFRHVTLPAIGPTLLLAAVMSVAGFLQLFAEPYVMTQGGPAQSTETVLYFMFDEGFKWWNLGQASAVALVLFLMILALTMVQTRIGRRYEWL